jgi:hypothetical protein
MNDGEVRGLVLRRRYDLRNEFETVYPKHLTELSDKLGKRRLTNVLSQLSDLGLIYYKPHTSLNGTDFFQTRILGPGVDVVEGRTKPPTSIAVDKSITVQNSQNVMAGGAGNTQNVTMNIEKMKSFIDNSEAPRIEKEEAKSLLQTLSENKLIQAALAAAMGWTLG